jgi:hypothetical protein
MVILGQIIAEAYGQIVKFLWANCRIFMGTRCPHIYSTDLNGLSVTACNWVLGSNGTENRLKSQAMLGAHF